LGPFWHILALFNPIFIFVKSNSLQTTFSSQLWAQFKFWNKFKNFVNVYDTNFLSFEIIFGWFCVLNDSRTIYRAQFNAGTMHCGTTHRAQLTAAQFTAAQITTYKSPRKNLNSAG
jgi:hypothetical protein